MIRFAALAAACAMAGAALAEPATLSECDGFTASARNLMMPPSESIRQFANGAVRLYWLDTTEPACCSSHLMVIQPAPNDPYEMCTLVSASENLGFGGMDLSGAAANYEPTVGLTVSIPVNVWEGDGPDPATLYVVINQGAGTVTTEVVQ